MLAARREHNLLRDSEDISGRSKKQSYASERLNGLGSRSLEIAFLNPHLDLTCFYMFLQGGY